MKKFVLTSGFFTFVFLIANLFFASTAFGQATVTTDLLDYQPGETVIITGTGFQSGETVTLLVEHVGDEPTGTDPQHHQPWDVIADIDGNIQTTWDVPTDGDSLGATFILTADGQSSFFHAEAFFTDAVKTWDRGAGTNNWGDANNWNTNGVPAFDAAVSLAVISGNDTTVNVNVNSTCGSITFPTNNDDDVTLNVNNNLINLTVATPVPQGSPTTLGNVIIPRANSGSINTLAVGAGTLNVGSIAFTNGGTTNRHQLTISTGTVTVTGNITQTGSDGSATVTFTGSGLLKLGGSFLTPATGTLNAGTGTIEYNALAAQIVQNFTYNHLTLSGSGSKTLAGSTTVNGNLSVNAAAILTLSVASERISNATSVVLGGGTLSTAGFTETIGTLNLTASTASTITLGLGNHSLNFANSSSTPWAAGATLTITGWGGTAGVTNATGGKIFFDNSATALTVDQLSKIRFSGYPDIAPILLSSGELVPQPLPTWSITGAQTACVGADKELTFNVTTLSNASNGAFSINFPTSFTLSSASVVSVTGGKPWISSISGSSVCLRRFGANVANNVTNGEIIVFSVIVNASTAAGSPFSLSGFSNINSNTCPSSVTDGPAQTLSPTIAVGTPPPATPTITGSISVCSFQSGLTYSISSVAGSSYTWTVPTGWGINSGQGTNSISVTSGLIGQNGNIGVTVTNTCGSGVGALAVSLLDDIGYGGVPSANSLTTCRGVAPSETIIGGNPSGSQDYQWEVSTTSPGTSGFNDASGDDNNQTYEISSTYYNTVGTYYFRRVIDNNSAACNGNSDVVTLIVNPGPAVAASTGTQTVCIGATTQFANATAGGDWSTTNAGIATVDGVGLVTGVSAATTNINYTVTGANGCVTTVSRSAIVITIPAQPSSIDGPLSNAIPLKPNPVCPNIGNIVYDVNNVAGVTYNWIVPTGWLITSGQGTNSIAVTSGGLGQDGDITVTPENSCGLGSQRSLAVSIFDANDIGFNSVVNNNLLTVCTGTTGTIIGGNPTDNQDYQWQVSTISTAGPFSIVSPNPGDVTEWTISSNYYNVPGTYYFRRVISNNTNCNGGSDVVTFVVNANPTVTDLTGTQTVCVSSTTTFASTTSGGVWTSDNAGVASVVGGVVTGVSAGSAIISYAVTNASNCITTVTRIVTVNATPSVSLVASPIAICLGQSTTLSATNSGGTLTVSGSNNTVVADNGIDPQSVSSSIVLPSGILSALSKITLTINATHTYVGDVTATLTSPCGGSTIIFNRPNGGTGNNSDDLVNGNYIFKTTGASFPGSNGGQVPPSTYAATFSGIPIYPACASIAGTWTLTLSTIATGNDRTISLNGWSLSIADAAPYTTVFSGPGTFGTVVPGSINNSTPSVSATPPAGVHTYTGTTTSAFGCSSSANVIVTVNEPPILNLIGNKSIDEETALTFTATATDADVPTQTLTYSLDAVSITAGMTIDDSTGAFSWTPSEAQDGANYPVTITVTDNGTCNLVDTEAITITVNEVNVAPLLTAIGNKSVNEEIELSFNNSATDHDLPAQTLTYSLDTASLLAGMSIDGSTGAFSWTPTESQGGVSYPVTVTVTDNGANAFNLSDFETFNIVVAEVNVAPELTMIGDRNVNEQSNLAFSATATDHDLPAQTLTFTLDATSIANGMGITAGGAFSWTPTESQGGTSYPVTITVTDNGANAANLFDVETFNIVVAEVNVAPVLTSVGNKTIDEETQLTFTATATDQDLPEQSLTFSLVDAPDGASITAAGIFTWTPTEAQGAGNYTFKVKVTDNGLNTDNLSDEEEITVTVNEVNVAPVLAAIGNKSVNEEIELSFNNSATDHDLPAQTLTYSLDAASLLAGMSIDGSTGAFSWTPTESQGGVSYPVTVTVTDNGSNAVDLSDFETFNIVVAEVNVAPELTLIGDRNVNEQSNLAFSATATDHDLPAQTLTFTLDATSIANGMSITDGGAFSWTPTESQGGTSYPVTITVTDNGANAANLFDVETFNIVVAEVNVAPVLTSVGNKTIDEETQLTFTATATDQDLPEQSLTFSLINAPAGASITAAGIFTWTPTEAQGAGNYTFKVKVTDNGLNTDNLSDEEEITVTVNEINVAPVLATIGNKSTAWGNELAFTATATDYDLNPANILTYSLVGAPVGASIGGLTGEFTWTPTEAQGAGTYTFTVKVTDNGVNLANLTDQESITVTVAKRITQLVYNGDLLKQYSDQANLSATLNDITNGLPGTPVAGKTITFVLGSQSVTATTGNDGIAARTLILTQSPTPAYNVVSTYVADASYFGSNDSDVFDITQENDPAFYTGPEFASTGTATATTAKLRLTALVSDDADGYRGDIRNAVVTFVITPYDCNSMTAGLPITVSASAVALVNASDLTIGTAFYDYTFDIGTCNAKIFDVKVCVGNYYTAVSDIATITVAKSLNDFVTGGGHHVFAANTSNASCGTYKSDDGSKTNFGFNVKYNKTGTNLQGNVNVIIRSGGNVYQMKGIVGGTNGSLATNVSDLSNKRAVLTTKSSMINVVTGLAVPDGSKATMELRMNDKGEPGAKIDTFIIKVWGESGALLYSSSCSNAEVPINGGNIQVRSTIIGLPTTTTLVSSLISSTVGNSVTFTATIGRGSSTVVPSGIVTFKDGTTTLGTAAVTLVGTAYKATFATSALTVGSHPITAVFSGDAKFNSSTSTILTQTVTSITTKVSTVDTVKKVAIEPTLAIELILFDVIAYPNPTDYQFTITVEGGSTEKIEADVFDMQGRSIKHFESVDNQPIVFGEQLPAGTYLVLVSQGANKKTLQLIKN